MVLVELGVVEQRFQAVLEVLGGASVSDVARRYGVVRQTVHRWLRKYAESGVSGLADQSSRPHSCPHQMPAVIEARVVEMRRAHPGWGPRTILYWLGDEGVVPLPYLLGNIKLASVMLLFVRGSVGRLRISGRSSPRVRRRCGGGPDRVR